MTTLSTIRSLIFLGLLILQCACKQNHPPVIEQFLCEYDSVKPGQQIQMEVVISDADNDATKCYWFFNSKRNAGFDHKTKIIWTPPNYIGDVIIKVIADDGKSETCSTKTIVVY